MRADRYIVVTFKFKQEGQKWTACCVDLGTATFGSTFEEAQKRIEEAVLLHLNTLEECGERERFFREHNIKIYPHKPRKDQMQICGNYEPATFLAQCIYPV